jgi:asparagine N-glycosylation enzyme membrane subunit Stt3
MPGLPLAIKVAVAAVLIVSIWRSLYGPPPDHRDMVIAKIWGATAAVLYFGGIAAIAAGRSQAWLLLTAGAVALCLAFWHARGDDGGGGGGDPGDDTPGPIDWDQFDRARREWDRPRVPA